MSFPLDSRQSLVLRTALQSLVFWLLFLALLPWMLTRVEHAAGWTPPPMNFTTITVGLLLFVCGGALNVWAAVVMIHHGRGTPLPTAMAARLVTRGPYARLRNPMAVGGLAQGMAVAIVSRSPLTAFYVLLGGIVWQVLVRPIEEREMRARFGEPFEGYRRRVRCWWPIGRTVAASSAALPRDPAIP